MSLFAWFLVVMGSFMLVAILGIVLINRHQKRLRDRVLKAIDDQAHLTEAQLGAELQARRRLLRDRSRGGPPDGTVVK